MILFPLAIDADGGLLTSNDPTDIAASEIYAILDTVVYSRVMRMDYGTRTFILDSLDLGSLVTEVNLKLQNSLNSLGLDNIELRSESTLADFQQGIVKLRVYFQKGGVTESLFYVTDYEKLGENSSANR